MTEQEKVLMSIADGLNTKKVIEDFVKSFRAVTEIFKQMKADNAQERAVMTAKCDKCISDMEMALKEHKGKMSASMKEATDKAMAYCMKEMEKMHKEQENDLNFLRDKVRDLKDGAKGEKGEDGKDGTEIEPGQIRDKLETLNGDERLRIEAIHNLREELDELTKKKAPSLGGGGFNYSSVALHLVDDETPTGTINGSNTAFTLAHKPSPTTSLKVYLNGQRLRITEDYTLSGTTLTFNSAPLTGSILLVDYRI